MRKKSYYLKFLFLMLYVFSYTKSKACYCNQFAGGIDGGVYSHYDIQSDQLMAPYTTTTAATANQILYYVVTDDCNNGGTFHVFGGTLLNTYYSYHTAGTFGTGTVFKVQWGTAGAGYAYFGNTCASPLNVTINSATCFDYGQYGRNVNVNYGNINQVYSSYTGSGGTLSNPLFYTSYSTANAGQTLYYKVWNDNAQGPVTFTVTGGTSVPSTDINGDPVVAVTWGSGSSGTISASGSSLCTPTAFTVTINPIVTVGTISPTTYLAGSSISIPFTLNGIVNSGNVFTAQLSNASGSFSSGTATLGTITGTTSGTISGIIPINAGAGTNYRIRILTSNPGTTGVDNGTNISITPFLTITGISPTTYNAGSSISIPFTLNGTVVSGNVFTAELSNASGSFASGTTPLGTLTGTSSGTISGTIPSTTAYSTSYRIRITTSNPSTTSADNGVNITVNPTVTVTSISPTTYNIGASISIPFTITGTYNSGNVFTAQLSNSSGSFASGTATLGTLTGTTAGTISGTIPITASGGSNYRIRILSSNPAITGVDNGTNITITTNAITTGSLGVSTIYVGKVISVPFTSTGAFNLGNTFTAQLSNSSGSFSSGTTNIGNLSTAPQSTYSASIYATIPSTVSTGSNYRIRVIATNPAVTGTDNGANLTLTVVNPNNQLSFDGVDDKVTIAHNAAYNIGAGNFTIEAWVRVPSGSSEIPVISKRTTSSDGFLLSLHSTGLALIMKLSSTTIISSALPSSIFDNNCHHVAVSRSGTSVTLWIDNTALGTFTVSASMNSTGPVYIGYDAVSNTSFNGTIDDVRIWNVSKTLTDITAAQNSMIPGNTTGLIGYWDFNEVSGQNVYDISTTSNNGYLGDVSTSDTKDPARLVNQGCYSQVLQKGLVLDGVDDRAEIPASTAPAGDFTMEAWVQLPSQTYGVPTILSNRSSSSPYDGFIFGIYAGTRILFQSNGVNWWHTNTFTSIYDNSCHHVAVSRASGVYTFYLDGIAQTGNPVNSTSIVTTRNIWVGNDYVNAQPISGKINEIRIWNVARTATDIANYKSVVIPSNSSNLVGYWQFDEASDELIYDGSANLNNGYLGSNATQFDSQNPLRSSTSCFSGDKIAAKEVTYNIDSTSYKKQFVSIYPNPSNSEFNVLIKGKSDEQSMIRIVDMKGTTLLEEYVLCNHPAAIGRNLPAGIYFVQIISSSSDPKVYKVIKVE